MHLRRNRQPCRRGGLDIELAADVVGGVVELFLGGLGRCRGLRQSDGDVSEHGGWLACGLSVQGVAPRSVQHGPLAVTVRATMSCRAGLACGV